MRKPKKPKWRSIKSIKHYRKPGTPYSVTVNYNGKDKPKARKPKNLSTYPYDVFDCCIGPDNCFEIATEGNTITWAIEVRDWLNKYIAWKESK